MPVHHRRLKICSDRLTCSRLRWVSDGVVAAACLDTSTAHVAEGIESIAVSPSRNLQCEMTDDAGCRRQAHSACSAYVSMQEQIEETGLE
mmetsp:Transcript_125273/g.348566  ORF Transcript_125273/g.348566 Transcript_125273/m.348566 type:complete len:90 (-) Transcript_125273:179-448(-)